MHDVCQFTGIRMNLLIFVFLDNSISLICTTLNVALLLFCNCILSFLSDSVHLPCTLKKLAQTISTISMMTLMDMIYDVNSCDDDDDGDNVM